MRSGTARAMTETKTNTSLEVVVAKRRWTAEDARRVLAEQAAGETQERLAQRLGLDAGRLSRWHARLARLGSASPSPKARRGTGRRGTPVSNTEIAFTAAGSMTLGRPRPCAIVEVVEGHLRIEVWEPSSLVACIEAARSETTR